jgi:hypothetical protein
MGSTIGAVSSLAGTVTSFTAAITEELVRVVDTVIE